MEEEEEKVCWLVRCESDVDPPHITWGRLAVLQKQLGCSTSIDLLHFGN